MNKITLEKLEEMYKMALTNKGTMEESYYRVGWIEAVEFLVYYMVGEDGRDLLLRWRSEA